MMEICTQSLQRAPSIQLSLGPQGRSLMVTSCAGLVLRAIEKLLFLPGLTHMYPSCQLRRWDFLSPPSELIQFVSHSFGGVNFSGGMGSVLKSENV